MSAIAQHEDMFRVPFKIFHENFWIGRQGTSPPDMADATGTVKAYINHGRWVVECPAGCGHAIAASVSNPYFLCTMCGTKTNSGQWFHVTFPAERAEIEQLLVQRAPAHPTRPNMPYFVNTRNWEPDETVEQLEQENRKRGVR